MIWSYLIHLGTNMWGDTPEHERFNVPISVHGDVRYRDYLLTDRAVWREVTDFIAGAGLNTLIIDIGEGVRFESHPELAVSGSWTKRELADELARLRSIGLNPIPKLNFSSAHDAFLQQYSRMLSTPEYYRVCGNLIDETIELFDTPDYFHLGLDEETYEHQRGFAYTVVRSHDLWWHDAYFLFDRVEAGGSRPWVWSDYYWHNPESFIRHMPKSVLQSNWWYAPLNRDADGNLDRIETKTYQDLAKLGYDQVPTGSTWGFHGNLYQTVWMAKEYELPNIKGFMAAPWIFTTEENKYGLMNDAHRLGMARREIYGE